MCLKIIFLIIAVYNIETNANPTTEKYVKSEFLIESVTKLHKV